MNQQDLRTYKRRGVTRESGYHTCDDTTGGECIITNASKITCNEGNIVFHFHRDYLRLVELFEKGLSIVAFGGYIHSKYRAIVSLDMDYIYEGQGYAIGEGIEFPIDEDSWRNIGFHSELIMNTDSTIVDVNVKMKITSQSGNELNFIGFDFDIISKDEFLDGSIMKYYNCL